uniref:Auxin Efflux Carrier family protein n=1 Tax=Arundo donax TaxID=35708 RepID=A0A0A9FNS0_ARUDO
MALGGFYIWTHTHSVIKRSAQIYLRMQRASIAAAATCLVIDPNKDHHSAALLSEEEEVAPEQDPSCWNDDGISLSPESVQDKITNHQLLLPLLSSHRLSGKSSNTLWEKLKEGTLQIMEELTAPPTIGAVIGSVIRAMPWLKSVFVGGNAPLPAVHNSLKLLGDGTIPCVTLILGGNLTKGVRKTAVPPVVVAAYVILPVTGVVVVKAVREMGFLPPDPLYQYVLMIQFALPPAVSIGTMAELYDVGQQECSVIFMWTYLVAALALTIWSTIFMSILLHQHP